MSVLPEAFLVQVARVDSAIQVFLRSHSLMSATAREVMPFLVDMGLFKRDNKEGRPLRDMLRELDRLDRLDLIRGLVVDRKSRNRYWYFTRV